MVVRISEVEGMICSKTISSNAPPVNCLGTKCMAWRWLDETLEFGFCGDVSVMPHEVTEEVTPYEDDD